MSRGMEFLSVTPREMQAGGKISAYDADLQPAGNYLQLQSPNPDFQLQVEEMAKTNSPCYYQ